MTHSLSPLAWSRPPLRAFVLTALLCNWTALAAAAREDQGQRREPSGNWLVCKEYGTVVGTFLTDVRGKDLVRLNFLYGEDVNPRFSPTADHVLFASTRGGTPGLWRMNRKGADQERLCDGDQGSWSPDGGRILLRRQGRIIERTIDTGKETVVSPARWVSCSWPANSPDNASILFMTEEGARRVIWVLARGKSKPRQLAEGEWFGPPRWSPGGDRIVCQRGAHLWVMDADGSNQRPFTTAGGVQCRPAWSPDGAWVVYSQGPTPKGPWQMAVTSADGSHRSPTRSSDLRSTLCSDWGSEQSGRTPQPQGAPAQPSPHIRLWEIGLPSPFSPMDWTAFCRERNGWKPVVVETARDLRGGCAIENDRAVLVLPAQRAEAILVLKPALQDPIRLTLLDVQGKEAGPIETLRVLKSGPDTVALESSARSAVGPVRVRWTMDPIRPWVQVTPAKNAGKLRLTVPMQGVVVPDRFGNDWVADPAAVREGPVFLPWAPLVSGLFGDGSNMLVLVCPESVQRTELRKGNGPAFASADLALGKHGAFAGVLAGERIWRIERFSRKPDVKTAKFDWRMPAPASWRLAVQGDGPRYSAFFSEKESELYDQKDVLLPVGDATTSARLGLIYLYGRTPGTPPEVLTPLDCLRDALGVKAAARANDEEGLTHYRQAAACTTWADLSSTLESLRYLFERQLEVQDAVYARHLADDLLPLVRGLDQRLGEYADFARNLPGLSQALDAATPAAAKLAEELAAVKKQFDQLAERQRSLPNPDELPPFVQQLAQLTSRESDENRSRFEQCRKQILARVGPREEMLKTCRQLAIRLRDAAATAPLVDARLLDPAAEIRARCQGVLRNRFHVEGDWRGEDYAVPAFWLGPRPYE